MKALRSHIYILLILFYTAIPSALFSYVTIYDIPKESNIADLYNNQRIREDILKLIDSIEEGKSYIPRINYLTPREVKSLFSDWIIRVYGEEEGKKIINNYFTDKYFGAAEKTEEEKTPYQIVTEDPYLETHIFNALRSTSNRPGREENMEEARKRWNVKTLFLTPEEVFNALPGNTTNILNLESGTFEEFKEKYPEKAEAIFSEKFFIPRDPAERKSYFLTHSLGFFDQKLVDDIYQTAKRIMKLTHQGDCIVIFGNTPYFVGRALHKLISLNPDNENYRTIIEFPFSGSPNRVRPLSFPDYKNLVTSERLEHLQTRLQKVGLSIENKSLQKQGIYFVDVIATGSGVAYVIEEILRSFITANEEIPNINIISLNQIDIHNENDVRNAQIAEQNAADGDKLLLFFPNKSNPHFAVDAYVIYLPGHGLLDNLPSIEWRIFPEYNPAYWLPEYDYILHWPEGEIAHILLEFFDTNLEYIMAQDTGL